MVWQFFPNDNSVKGTRVSGDPTVPPTKWYSRLWLLWFVWKKVTVFQVSLQEADKGFRIGFVPERGRPMIMSDVLHDLRFRIRNGREDCTFFALTAVGNARAEVELTVVKQTTADDKAFNNLPLY